MASGRFKTYKDDSTDKEYFEWIEFPTRAAKGERLASEEENLSLVLKFPRWKVLGHVEGTTAHVFCLLHGESYTHVDMTNGNWTLEEDYYRITILIPYDGSPITVEDEAVSVIKPSILERG